MVRYIPILDKVGVKVTCKKPSSKEKTRWTIEGPAWDFGDLERIIARLWFEQHTDGSARDRASFEHLSYTKHSGEGEQGRQST
jgi:hypothetical protein